MTIFVLFLGKNMLVHGIAWQYYTIFGNKNTHSKLIASGKIFFSFRFCAHICNTWGSCMIAGLFGCRWPILTIFGTVSGSRYSNNGTRKDTIRLP